MRCLFYSLYAETEPRPERTRYHPVRQPRPFPCVIVPPQDIVAGELTYFQAGSQSRVVTAFLDATFIPSIHRLTYFTPQGLPLPNRGALSRRFDRPPTRSCVHRDPTRDPPLAHRLCTAPGRLGSRGHAPLEMPPRFPISEPCPPLNGEPR